MAVEPSRWGIIYNPKAGSRKTQKRWNEIRDYMGSALWSGWRGHWPITVIEPL